MDKHAGTARLLFNKADKINPGLPDNVFNAVKTVGAAIIAGFFVDKLLQFIDKNVMLPMSKEKYFNKMIEENPKLSKEDPQEVADLWNTLYSQSPNLSKDPVAAGAFITQMIQRQMRAEYGGPTLDTYEALSKITKNKADSKGDMRGANEMMDQTAGAIKTILGIASGDPFAGGA